MVWHTRTSRGVSPVQSPYESARRSVRVKGKGQGLGLGVRVEVKVRVKG